VAPRAPASTGAARPGARLRPLFDAERDAVEARWRVAPPEPSAAFAEADRMLAAWTGRVAAEAGPDTRPRVVRRYWRLRGTGELS
jgi:hypothetical protein